MPWRAARLWARSQPDKRTKKSHVKKFLAPLRNMRPKARVHRAWSIACLLAFASCTANRSFRVLPRNPGYVLRLPNSQELPFSDVLRAYNGFTRGQRWIDLRPLMELEIENAYYQKGASRRGLAGFLGTEVAFYDITAQGLHLLSTRPMKDRPPDELPVQQLISERSLRFRFYRLYFEIVFVHAGNAHGSVLLGADSMDELARLSNELAQPELVCNAASTHCVVFPEACSVSVQMKIVVNGLPQTVVWGSSLESIADHQRQLSVKRLYRGRLVPVKVNATDPGALNLPLLPGDQIDWK